MAKVLAGQTASGIAKAAGMTPAQFLALNPSFAAKGNAKDYQGLSGAIQIGQEYNLAAPVNNPSTEVVAPVVPTSNNQNNPIVSGAPVAADNAAIGLDLKALTEGNTNTQKLLQDRMTELESRREQEIAQIRAEYEQAAAAQAERQAKDYAGRSTNLVTSGGGFLGTTQSQQGVLQNLRQAHEVEKGALMAKRDSAIQAAQNAYDDKSFSLAKEKIAEAKSYEQEIYSRQKDFADQELALAREARAKTEFEMGITEDKLKAYAELAANDQQVDLDPTIVAQIDKQYGVPGYTKQYLEIARAEAEGKNIENSIDLKNKLQTLINKTPYGQVIVLPDGTQYVGMKKASTGSAKGLIAPELAVQLGIPSLSGKDESNVVLSLSLENPPEWYKEFYKSSAPDVYSKITPSQLANDWKLFTEQPDIKAYKNSAVVSGRIAAAENEFTPSTEQDNDILDE